MGYSKNAEDVTKAFPHGVKYVRDNQPAIELVNLSVQDSETGVPTLIGWTPPNKDIYIDLDNVLVRKSDWLVFSRGQRISLRPITEARAEQVEEMLN